MVDGSRFYRERAIQIERRFTRRPNAAGKFSACPKLIDLHICMDIRFHRFFCIFVEPNAACRTAVLIGILPVSMGIDGDETVCRTGIVLIAMNS